MILSEKKQIRFIDWYKSIYGDTSPKTGTGELPKVHESKQREHIKMWKDFLKELLGRDAKKIYTHKGGREEDYLHLAFNSLYFNYGPTYIDDNGDISKEHLWIDDVE